MGDVALGFRPHCGWAVAVAVTVPPGVALVARERVELLGPGDPAQPWHVAQDRGLSPDDAAALADRVADGARSTAAGAVGTLLAAVDAAGHRAVTAAVIGAPTEVPDAARVLRSHSLLHLAEGQLFWAALADALDDAGVPVVAAPAKAVDLAARADLLRDLGKAAGPPWRADHKLAVAAALDAAAAP